MLVSRFDEVLPEGIVYACPVCGAEVLFNCYHDYDITSIKMTKEEAAHLRETSGEYRPHTAVCKVCDEDKEILPGAIIGNGLICADCANV